MPTFLTTPRMAPELAVRVLASVRGERGTQAQALRGGPRPGLVAAARVAVVALLVGLTFSVVTLYRRDLRELDVARASLLETVRAAGAGVTAEDIKSVAGVTSWLQLSAAAYAGDLTADELHATGALAALLSRPALYVRGTVAQLATPGGIAEAASTSVKDPFILCLLEPPTTRAESALLQKVHDAYSPANVPRASTIRWLRDADVGLPFLAPAWAEGVRHATSVEELALLRRDFERAPIDGATLAARARLLVLVVDEPSDSPGPTELDGERAHPVRVGLVDLAASRVLLRQRRRVDPAWISAAKRPMYAAGLDACLLALDVRESVAR